MDFNNWTKWKKTILHIDMNAFFLHIEQQIIPY